MNPLLLQGVTALSLFLPSFMGVNQLDFRPLLLFPLQGDGDPIRFHEKDLGGPLSPLFRELPVEVEVFPLFLLLPGFLLPQVGDHLLDCGVAHLPFFHPSFSSQRKRKRPCSFLKGLSELQTEVNPSLRISFSQLSIAN